MIAPREGFNQLVFCETAVPHQLTGDGFAVLLSARQLALLPIVPGSRQNFASIPNFIQGVCMAGRLLSDVQLRQIKVINFYLTGQILQLTAAQARFSEVAELAAALLKL